MRYRKYVCCFIAIDAKTATQVMSTKLQRVERFISETNWVVISNGKVVIRNELRVIRNSKVVVRYESKSYKE